MQYPLLFALLMVTLVLSSGCASKRLAQNDRFDQITFAKAAKFSGDSERALGEAEVKYEAAINANMDFYAPLHMEQVNEALALARESELKGIQSDSIIASAKVITLLQLAEQNKSKIEVLLQPLLKQKLILEQLNSPKVLPAEFNNLLGDIKELITEIEEGTTHSPSNIDPVLADLKRLELDTLLEVHWQPAKNTLEKAENEDADKHAPKSFAFAKELVEQTEITIRANYSDRGFVSKEGLAALRAAQHVLYVARDAERLTQLSSKHAEDAVLQFESLLAQIGQVLNASDLRHMALQDQASALAQYAEIHGTRLISQLRSQIVKLEAQLLAAQAAEEKIKPTKEGMP